MSDEPEGNSTLLAAKRPFTRAHVWWCGDEVCDCYQARIERLTPRGLGWDSATVWEGRFRTGGERAPCWDELLAECKRRDIPPGDSYAELSSRP